MNAIMNDDLRRDLRDAIAGEDWDASYVARLNAALDATPNGTDLDAIAYDDDTDDQTSDLAYAAQTFAFFMR